MLRDQSGGVLVTVAVTLPLLVLLCGFVIDTGNWWVHKRHLQTQADAAALAAAGKYRFPLCTDGTIAQTADQYGGIVGTPLYNEQVGAEQPQPAGDNDVTLSGTTPAPAPTPAPPRETHLVLNQKSWYDGRPDPADTDVGLSGSPCADKMVDVKMTETNVPWFFKAAGVDYIDAQARVALHGLTSFKGMLPVGVEDVNPKRVRVVLFDEDTGVDLAQAELGKRAGSTNGLVYFDNAVGRGDGPMTVDVRAQRIGARVVMSGSGSVTCGDPLVLCYGFGPVGTKGVVRVRGYETGGTGARLREVVLAPSTGCVVTDNAYFAAQCTEQIVNARISGLDPAANTKVDAVIVGSNQNHALTFNPVTGRWSGTVPVTPLGARAPGRSRSSTSRSRGPSGGQHARAATATRARGSSTMPTARSAPRGRSPARSRRRRRHAGRSRGRHRRRQRRALSRRRDYVPSRVHGGDRHRRSPRAGEPDRPADFAPRLQREPEPVARLRSRRLATRRGDRPRVRQRSTRSTTARRAPTAPRRSGSHSLLPGTAWRSRPARTPTLLREASTCASTAIPRPGGACPPDRRNFCPGLAGGRPSRASSRLRRALRVIRRHRKRHGAGDRLRVLLRDGLDRHGNGFRNPCKNDGDGSCRAPKEDSGAISGHFLKYVNPNTGGGGTEACDIRTRRRLRGRPDEVAAEQGERHGSSAPRRPRRIH